MDAIRIAHCKDCKKWFLAQWVSTLTATDLREFENHKKRGCNVVDYPQGRKENPLTDDYCQCKTK